MPRVPCGGVQLFCEEFGSGDAVVLIPGLGFWRWQWFKQVPFFSQYFRTVTLDNRCVGDSDQPDVPFTLADMAADTAHVIRSLNLAPAHVVGYSMGGSIALELALAEPELVRSLVLVSSTLGGPEQVSADPDVLARLVPEPALDHQANMRRSLPVVAGPGYWEQHPEEMEQVIAMRLSKPTPYAAFAQQLAAARGWPGLGDRAGRVQASVLVVHGDADQLVPVANGRKLAAQLSGQLAVIPGTGHLPFIEAAPMFNRLVTQFLRSI